MEYAVIMAGGSGTRFWPESTRNRPKQCLALNTDKPMIQETVDRLGGLFGDNLYIATGSRLKEKISEILPSVKFILEPMARNTTGCIGLACVQLLKKDPDAVIFMSGSDYVIKNKEVFLEYVKEGMELAKEGKIATIGITPFEPSSAFGYINFADLYKGNSYLVKGFVEKPSKEVAMRYLQEGAYLWNSGMYIFKASVMMEELKMYEPEIYSSLMKIYDSIGTENEDTVTKEQFEGMKSIQIDYSVSERSDNLVVVKADLEWDDIGSWTSLDRHREKDKDGNVVKGDFLGISSWNNIVFSDKMVATVGVEDMIIVSTDDVVFVCPKSRAQEIKLLIEKMKDKNMERFL